MIQNYTLLNTTMAYVLPEICDTGLVNWPQKNENPSKRNLDKYYHFHPDHGRDTKKCREFINEIEGLIERGHLKKFQRNLQCNHYGKKVETITEEIMTTKETHKLNQNNQGQGRKNMGNWPDNRISELAGVVLVIMGEPPWEETTIT